MKKERTKWIDFAEDIDMATAVEEFFDGTWYPSDWSDTEMCIDYYIKNGFIELSVDEATELKRELEKEFHIRTEELSSEQKDQFKDRASILAWINENKSDDWDFVLSGETILDLILQNGRN